MEELVPYLNYNHKYNIFAWSGLCTYSNWFTVDEIYILFDVFKQAICMIKNLDEEVRKRFVQHYCLMLLYIGNTSNITDIMMLLNELNDGECSTFIDTIRAYFKNNGQDTINNVWNRLVKQHLTNRVKGLHKFVGQLEANSILHLMVELKDQFPQMVNIICDNNFRPKIDEHFIYRLRNTNLINCYRGDVLILVTCLLDNIQNNSFFIIELIALIDDMQLTKVNTQTDLQIKLLKLGITLKNV